MINFKHCLFLYVVFFVSIIASTTFAQSIVIGNGLTLNLNSETISVSGDVIINGILKSTTGVINVGGNWTNNGIFTAGTGKVNFIDGLSVAAVSNSNQFYDLAVSTNTGRQFNLESGKTQYVSHALTLQGVGGHLLILRSSISGQQAYVNLEPGGSQTISYINVQDNNASGQYLALGPASGFGSVDSGNNLGWFKFGVPVAAVVTPSNAVFGTFVDSPFDLTTAFTDNESDVTGCGYTSDGTTWAAGTVSGTKPIFTCTKTGITGTNGQSLTLNMRATSTAGTGTAIAVSKTVDSASPITADNASNVWTGTSPVVVSLTPSDGTGSGVAQTLYCADTVNTCTPATSGTTVNVTCATGSVCSQYVKYQSKDNVGNAESVKASVAIRQDLKAPTDGTLTPASGNAQVLLKWTAATDMGSGLKTTNTYKLVRNTRTESATPNIPDVQCTRGIQVYLGTALTATDTVLTNGTTYDYRLCAYDNVDNISTGVTAVATPGNPGKMSRNNYHLPPEGWQVLAYTEDTWPYQVKLVVLAATAQPVPAAQIKGLGSNPLLITSNALRPDLTLIFDDGTRTAYLFHDVGGTDTMTTIPHIELKPAGAPVLSAPALVDAGSVKTGTTKDVTVTVSNTGTADLHVTSVTAPAAPFTKVSETCTVSVVAPLGTCSVVIRFSPSARSRYTGSFTINSDGGNKTVQLQGAGSLR